MKSLRTIGRTLPRTVALLVVVATWGVSHSSLYASGGPTVYLPLIMQGFRGQDVPTLLASYFIPGPSPHYEQIRYRPNQFTAGQSLGIAGDTVLRVSESGPYANWDVLHPPLSGVSTIAERADWMQLKLNRAATVVVVWRAGNPAPNWLSSWTVGPNVVIDGASVPTYRQSFSAGALNLGGVYNPGTGATVGRPMYLVLLAEADGRPTAPARVPAGRTPPQANQTCPAWVHDEVYVTKGPNGQTYPTWHPQIDPVYWCYFGHEHGSDPSLFKADYKPAYGYVSGVAGVDEPHAGFKSYAFDDGLGRVWLITHHFGTGGLKRACARHHSLDVAVIDKASGELLADVHLMGDFGHSAVNSTDEVLTPPTCPDQAAHAAGSHGIRKLPSAANGSVGYEPWRVDGRNLILGLNTADITFNTPSAMIICNSRVCDQGVATSRKGEFRFMTYEPGFGIVAGANTGVFHTDAMGKTLLGLGQPGAVQQYVKPGLNLVLPSVAPNHCLPLEPWRQWFSCTQVSVENGYLELESSLRNPN